MNIDMNEIYEAVFELSKTITYRNDINYFEYSEDFVEGVFKQYFEPHFLNMTVNLSRHHKEKYDGLTIKQILSSIKDKPTYKVIQSQSLVTKLKWIFTKNLRLMFSDIMISNNTKEKIIDDYNQRISNGFFTTSHICSSCGLNNLIFINDNEFSLLANFKLIDDNLSQQVCTKKKIKASVAL